MKKFVAIAIAGVVAAAVGVYVACSGDTTLAHISQSEEVQAPAVTERPDEEESPESSEAESTVATTAPVPENILSPTGERTHG